MRVIIFFHFINMVAYCLLTWGTSLIKKKSKIELFVFSFNNLPTLFIRHFRSFCYNEEGI